ncbi:FAD-dependent oxidoreductase [Desulfotignum balticum]|uniref:FAD-dependent oxidoreductase n=1 Tax=Desulfotignum balticum TaxID=115781 RepID=UPI000403EECD|nr:FAD-dependent oxidoreductase [Desulfotignum balticum]
MNSYLENLSDNILIDKDKCIFCGNCVQSCVCDNLRLNLAPCQNACPMDLNCQGYVQLVVRNDFEKALELINEKLPFPQIIGRICHHPCEDACERTKVDGQPVALKSLKRFIADHCQSTTHNEYNNISKRPEKIAVVGGGPAGVTASYYLLRSGYNVDIFEAGSELGGMTTNCVPEFRLPHQIAIEEYNIVKKMGANIHCHCKIGSDIYLNELIKKFDSVILSVGCQKNKKIGLAGEDAENVFQSLDFLKSAKNQDRLEIGKRIVVIGGGNTAVDVAQTAYRLGAESINIVCLEKNEEMPVYKDELIDAIEEGITIENGWGVDGFEMLHNKVTGINLKKCSSVFDDNGNFNPIFENDKIRNVSVDTIIIAIGQEPDMTFQETGIIDFHKINPLTLQIDSSNVFIAGDMVTGPKTVIDAMAQGRLAANSVDLFLQGKPLIYGRFGWEGYQTGFHIDTSKVKPIPRVIPSKSSLSSRRTFKEIEKTINQEQAVKESERCLSCGGPYGKYRTCWQCLACEVECQQNALYVEVPYLMK